MPDVTELLDAVEAGDPNAARQLLPLLYDELRQLATARLNREPSGQSLTPTALVHEAFLRLVGNSRFENRRHFFGAAAEAMRRVLIDRARARGRLRRGGEFRRIPIEQIEVADEHDPDLVLDVDAALVRLAERDPKRAELVRLRFFGGLAMPEVAEVMGISLATAERHWSFARTWLYAELRDAATDSTNS